MDDLNSYRVPSDEYWSYADKQAYKQELINGINSARLTSAEREKELKQVPAMVRAKCAEMDKPARERQQMLERKFWSDAREELGYPSYLTPEGVEILEAKAYQDGHAYGYPEIFNHLSDLDEFLYKMRDYLISPIPPMSDL